MHNFNFSPNQGKLALCGCYLDFTVCHDVTLQPTVVQNLDSLEALSKVW